MRVLLGLSVNGFAQQDPHDPGIQDSIIVDDVYVDTTAVFAIVPVYGVIDDSVGFYNVPSALAGAAGRSNSRNHGILFPHFKLGYAL